MEIKRRDSLNAKRKNDFFSWGFLLFDKWLQIKNKEESLQQFFEDNSIYFIAIYGMGVIGRRLYEELLNSPIKVRYGIDRNAKNIRIPGLDIRTLEEALTPVDAVIVTPMDFYEIEEKIYQKIESEIDVIFIEDIVNYCYALL